MSFTIKVERAEGTALSLSPNGSSGGGGGGETWWGPSTGPVNFLVGTGNDQDTFQGDKQSLACLSPVFAKMVADASASYALGSWVTLPDDDPVAFSNILKFASTGSAMPSEENALKTFVLARKYQVPQVAKECRAVILQKVVSGGVDFAVEVYEAGKKADDLELKKTAEKYLIQRFVLLVTSNKASFLKLSYTSVCEFLKNEDIVLYSEMNVFQVCLSWAKNECTLKGLDPTNFLALRGVLSDIRHLIRFPTIPRNVFVEKIQPLCILEPQDVELLHVYWNIRGNDPLVAEGMDLPFSKKKRTGQLQSVRCFKRKPVQGSIWNVLPDQWNSIKLKSSCSIGIHNIMLYGQIAEGKKSGSVCVKLLKKSILSTHGGQYHLKEEQTAKMITMPDNNIRIDFEPPLVVSAGDKHALRLRFLERGTQDCSMGTVFGTRYKVFTTTAKDAAEQDHNVLLKVKKVGGGDFLFHAVTFKLLRFLNDDDDVCVQCSEKMHVYDPCQIA